MTDPTTIQRDISWACATSATHGMIARMSVAASELDAHLAQFRNHAEFCGVVLRCEHTTPTLVLCSGYYPSRGPQAPEWRVEIEAA